MSRHHFSTSRVFLHVSQTHTSGFGHGVALVKHFSDIAVRILEAPTRLPQGKGCAGLSSRTASRTALSNLGSRKIAPSAQIYLNITGAFSKYDFCAYQIDVKLFQKSSPESVPKQDPRVASLFAKSGFLSDFQDFLKIDVEITQCQ